MPQATEEKAGMHGYAPSNRVTIGEATRSLRRPRSVVSYTLNAGGTLTVPTDETSLITYTGVAGTTATVIVSGESYTVRNSPGPFPCGAFVWDYLGSQPVTFSNIGQTEERNIGKFNFIVQWDGCGSHLFRIIPLGFMSYPSSALLSRYFSSAWADLSSSYFSSPWATTDDFFFNLPSGFLTWTNRMPDGRSELHGARTAETVSGPIDTNSLIGITKISPDDPHRIAGDSVLSPPYRSPSVYRTRLSNPRILSVSNGIPMFLFENGKDERRLDIPSQYAPKSIASHSHRENSMSATLYLESGNIYFFAGDEEDYSSSSESSESTSSVNSSSSESSSTSSVNSSSSSESSPSSESTAVLVSEWKLNETTESRFRDSFMTSRYMRPASFDTPANPPNIPHMTTAGKLNAAIYLRSNASGNRDYYAVGTPAFDSGFSNEFTVSMWLYNRHDSATMDDDNRGILLLRNPLSPSTGGLLISTGWGYAIGHKSLGIAIPSATVSCKTGGILNFNQWNFVTIVFKVNESLKVYVNGAETALLGSQFCWYPYTTGNSMLYLGYSAFVTAGDPGYLFTLAGKGVFDGNIDELCFFSKALSPSKVSWLWNGGNGREIL